MEVSQPLLGLPSQLAQLTLHVGLQAPEVQVVPPLGLVQVVAQVPQCATVLSEASQPLPTLLSQLPYPALQAIEQVAAEHVGVPLTVLHATPQSPQFSALVFRSISQPLVRALPSQLPHPELHAMEQLPVAHAAVPWLVLHAAPQDPQLATLVLRLVSQPLPELPSQSPCGDVHEATPQTPPTQFGVPPAAEQTCAQVPQLLTSELVCVSQPLLALASQLP
jgi:hypothetical protein